MELGIYCVGHKETGAIENMFSYPALYKAASGFSAASQSKYLVLIRMEYGLLFVASILSLDIYKIPIYYIGYALIFLGSLAVLITRNWLKPEQDWYKGRALAESIKTACWRYCMQAEPFGVEEDIGVRRREFRDFLYQIFQTNRHIGDRMALGEPSDAQITNSMEATRALTLAERQCFYAKFRIHEQRTWYSEKARANKKASVIWLGIGIAAYTVAIVLVLLRIGYSFWEIWPIEPIIVLASSIIGWTQVKKFNELASSYTLTAHEISILQERIPEVRSEAEFSDFINEAEQAFSREHTQWVARQHAH